MVVDAYTLKASPHIGEASFDSMRLDFCVLHPGTRPILQIRHTYQFVEIHIVQISTQGPSRNVMSVEDFCSRRLKTLEQNYDSDMCEMIRFGLGHIKRGVRRTNKVRL